MTRQIIFILTITFIGCGQRNTVVKGNTTNDTLHVFFPINNNLNGNIEILTEYDGKLFAAGKLEESNGELISNIACWDGKNWLPVGEGLNGNVMTLAVFNNELYAGGTFDKAGNVPVKNIAKWDGDKWTDVGGGTNGFFIVETEWVNGKKTFTRSINGYVNFVATFKNELYVSGRFDRVGEVSAHNFAKWDGKRWLAIGKGINDNVRALQVYKDTLYAAGAFDTIDNKPFNHIGVLLEKE